MSYDPDTDPNVWAEALVWGWRLHISHDAMHAEQAIEWVIDKIVNKVVKEIPELEPAAKPIKWTLKRHRKREAHLDEKYGTGVVLVSPWLMPTLLRPMKQHEDDTHMAWTSFDPNQQSWGDEQTLSEAFRSETGPSVVGFQDRLYSAFRGVGDDAQIYWTTFGSIRDEGDPDSKNLNDSELPVDWTDPQKVFHAYTSNEPALAALGQNLYLFFKGGEGDNQIWYSKWNGSAWDGGERVPNLFGKAGPGAVTFNGKIYCMVPGSRDSGHEDRLVWSIFDGHGWSQISYSERDKTHLPPGLVSHNDTLYIVYTGTDNSLFHTKLKTDTSLGDVVKFPNHESKDGPSLISYMGVIYCVVRGYKDDQIWYTYSRDEANTWSKHTRVTVNNGKDYIYSGNRPGFSIFRHSTGTRDQLLCLYRGAKV